MTIHVYEATTRRLLQVLRAGNGVLFCGAGLSMAPPAGSPDWYGLRDATLRAVATRAEPLVSLAETLVQTPMMAHAGRSGLTPEMVASEVSRHCSGYFESFRALTGSLSNSNHLNLARLAKVGLVRIIVTTNWDLHIERALEIEQVPFTACRTDEEIQALWALLEQPGFEGVHVVKLHGCLSMPKETIVVTVEQEARGLPLVKRQLLERLLCSCTLIFWGYSGMDLKIDPDYLRMLTVGEDSPGFIWDFYEPEEACLPHISGLRDAYQQRATIVSRVLPDALDGLIDLVPRVDLSGAQWQAWREEEADRLQGSLAAWAQAHVDPTSAAAILGHLLLIDGQPEGAAECFEFMAKAAQEAGEGARRADALDSLGCVHHARGDHAQALLSFRMARNIARAQQCGPGLVLALVHIAEIYILRGDPATALANLKEAQAVNRQVGSDDARLRILVRMGDVAQACGRLDEAERHCQEARALGGQAGLKYRLPDVLCRQGRIHLQYGEAPKALACFEEAERIASALGLRSSAGRALSEQGYVLTVFGDLARAGELLDEALALAVRLGDPVLQARIDLCRALALVRRDPVDEVDTLRRAAKVCEALGMRSELIEAYPALARVVEDIQPLQAIEWLEKAHSFADENQETLKSAIVLHRLGDLWARLGHTPGAREDCSREAFVAYVTAYVRYLKVDQQQYLPEIVRRLNGLRALAGATCRSLGEILAEAATQEPFLHPLLAAIADGHGVEPFAASSLCERLTETHGYEEMAALRLLADLQRRIKHLHAQGEHARAQRCYLALVQPARELSYGWLAAAFLNEVGRIAVGQGQDDDALSCFTQAVELAQAERYDKQAAISLVNLASIHLLRKEYDPAIARLRAAEQIGRTTNDVEVLSRALVELGNAYKEKRDHPPALACYDEALPLIEDLGDEQRLLDIVSGLGKSCYDEGQYEMSVHFRRKALELLERRGDRANACLTCGLIANTCRVQLNRPDDARTYDLKALALAEVLEQQGPTEAFDIVVSEAKRLAQAALHGRGAAPPSEPENQLYDSLVELARRTDIAEPERFADVTLAIAARQSGWKVASTFDPKSYAFSVQQRYGAEQGYGIVMDANGNHYRGRGDLGLASALFQEALRVATMPAQTAWRTRLLMALTRLYGDQDDEAKALEFGTSALATARKGKHLELIDQAAYVLGELHTRHARHAEALTCYRQALDAARQAGDLRGMGYDSFKIGLSCKHQGNHNEALRWLEEARQHLAGEEGVTAWLGNTLLMIGECHFELGSPDQAINCFEQAADLAVSAGDVPGVVKTYNGLAGLYRQLGDERNADRWLTSLRQVLASLGIDPSVPAKP